MLAGTYTREFYLDESSGKKIRTRTDEMKIVFTSKMTVSEQFFSYGFLSYIAENGGFVGLFLGYSVLQLRDLIHVIFFNQLKIQ